MLKKFLESISVKPKRLFRLMFWNFFFAYLPIAAIIGAYSLFGINLVEFNNGYLSPIQGLLYSIIISPLMAFSFTLGAWLLFMFGHVCIKGSYWVFFGRHDK
jgi:hypothetical protein